MRKILAATALIAVVALGLSTCGSSSSGSSGSSKSTTTTKAAAKAPVTLTGTVNNKGTKDVSTKGSTADVDMDLYNFYFEPTFVKAAPGQKLTISLHNEGSVPHTFTVPMLNIDKELQPEQKMTVTVTVPMSGTVPFHCRFHQDNGMQGRDLHDRQLRPAASSTARASAARACSKSPSGGAPPQVPFGLSSIAKVPGRPEGDALPTPAADVALLLRRAGFERDRLPRSTSLTPLDLPAIVDTLLDFSPNPADTPPPSLADPTKADWERMQDLQQWWLDRMATVPRPLQEKLTLFWHGHFATQYEKVGSTRTCTTQNRAVPHAPGPGASRTSCRQMSLQVAMLIYLDNDPNSKGSPNENFARELMELFTLGVNQYTQADVVASAQRVDRPQRRLQRDARAYRFYPERHDTAMKTFMGTTQNWDGPQIITRILTVDPQRSIAARFIAQEALDVLRVLRTRRRRCSTTSSTVFVGSDLDIAHVAARRSSCARSSTRPTARQGLVRSPVEWIVTMPASRSA